MKTSILICALFVLLIAACKQPEPDSLDSLTAAIDARQDALLKMSLQTIALAYESGKNEVLSKQAGVQQFAPSLDAITNDFARSWPAHITP